MKPKQFIPPIKKKVTKLSKKVIEKSKRLKQEAFGKIISSENIKLKVSIERDSKNKKYVYIDNLIVDKSTKITAKQLLEVLSKTVNFAKENKIDNIKTHSWIFVKYPAIQERLGFKPASIEAYKLFLKKLKDNNVDNVIGISKVSYAHYSFTGNYYYLKYTSKKSPKEVKIIGSNKLGEFPLFEKKL